MYSFQLSMAVDASGKPYVAWYERKAGTNPIIGFNQHDGTASNGYVSAWNNAWSSLGYALSAAPGNTAATIIGLGQDSKGRVVVAWNEQDSTGDSAVFVQRHNGASFLPLGTINAVQGENAGRGELAVDSCDHIYVAFDEPTGGVKDVHVWVYRDY
jgi:hypothetical protein